jgi:hypothetical protein
MGLDSVELIMGWEEAFGIPLSDDEAFALRTPRMAIDLIARKVGASDQPREACFTLRAFHRLRASVVSVTAIDRRSFRPAAQLKDLASRRQWDGIRSKCGIQSLPNPGLFSPRTVADLTRWAVIHAAKDLKPVGEPWSRAEIRSIVREVVADVTGLDEFGDDDDFIKDLRVD